MVARASTAQHNPKDYDELEFTMHEVITSVSASNYVDHLHS